jgi:hypothetical protein
VSQIAFRWENRPFVERLVDAAMTLTRRRWIGLAVLAVVIGAAGFLAYQKWGAQSGGSREEMLALIPPEASAVAFADFDELRRAPFFAELYAWAPKPQADAEYAEFLKQTGFDYERDLDRIAIASIKREPESTLFAIVDGKFDKQKISAYAAKSGSVSNNNGREIFSVAMSGSAKKLSFTFLRKDRIALTDDTDLNLFLKAKKRNEDTAEWHVRFERLGGSPVFAVIRQNAAAGAALAAQAPGGLRSPQLSSLLDQLQWITVAGKPENELLRVVAEGECSADGTARQLADLLNGVLALAQAGLNDAKTRQQLDPAAREAYLELLKGADVSKIDRGDTKSVRLVFEITAKFLETARIASPASPGPAPTPDKPVPGKRPAPRKGHT